VTEGQFTSLDVLWWGLFTSRGRQYSLRGGHYSPVNNVLGGHYSLVNIVQGRLFTRIIMSRGTFCGGTLYPIMTTSTHVHLPDEELGLFPPLSLRHARQCRTERLPQLLLGSPHRRQLSHLVLAACALRLPAVNACAPFRVEIVLVRII